MLALFIEVVLALRSFSEGVEVAEIASASKLLLSNFLQA